MKLDLGAVSERETFSFQGAFSMATQEGGEAECSMEVTGSVVKTGSRIILEASIDAIVRIECSRCLSPFDMPVTAGFRLVFDRGDRVQAPEGADEDDFILLSDADENRYDIFPRAREAVILELPIKLLCNDDCRGLCGRCGTNLNEGRCGCAEERGDPRWGPLKNLLNEDENN